MIFTLLSVRFYTYFTPLGFALLTLYNPIFQIFESITRKGYDDKEQDVGNSAIAKNGHFIHYHSGILDVLRRVWIDVRKNNDTALDIRAKHCRSLMSPKIIDMERKCKREQRGSAQGMALL